MHVKNNDINTPNKKHKITKRNKCNAIFSSRPILMIYTSPKTFILFVTQEPSNPKCEKENLFHFSKAIEGEVGGRKIKFYSTTYCIKGKLNDGGNVSFFRLKMF